MSWLDPSLVIDPFTFGALVGIAMWLDRRLRNVEKTLAYTRGFREGQEREREVISKNEHSKPDT